MERQRSRQQRMPGLGPQGKKKKKQPHMILTTGVKEGPAKRNTTIKTFEVYKDDIDGTSIRLAKRGGGRAYGKNS